MIAFFIHLHIVNIRDDKNVIKITKCFLEVQIVINFKIKAVFEIQLSLIF